MAGEGGSMNAAFDISELTAPVLLIILAIVEVTLRLKLKKDGSENGISRASSDDGTSDENN